MPNCTVSNQDLRRALPKWLHHYNFHPPHTELRGQPSAAAVNKVCRHYLVCYAS